MSGGVNSTETTQTDITETKYTTIISVLKAILVCQQITSISIMSNIQITNTFAVNVEIVRSIVFIQTYVLVRQSSEKTDKFYLLIEKHKSKFPRLKCELGTLYNLSHFILWSFHWLPLVIVDLWFAHWSTYLIGLIVSREKKTKENNPKTLKRVIILVLCNGPQCSLIYEVLSEFLHF